MVLTHVYAVAVQVQRFLEVTLLERSVAFHLQLVRSGAAFAPVLRSLVTARQVLQCAKEQTSCCTHVILHGLELCGFRRGWGRQLLVGVVAVVEVVPLQAVEKDERGRQARGCSCASYLAVVLSSVSVTNILLGGLPVVKHEGEFGSGRHQVLHRTFHLFHRSRAMSRAMRSAFTSSTRASSCFCLVSGSIKSDLHLSQVLASICFSDRQRTHHMP